MQFKSVQQALRKHASKKKAAILQRFFKTGPGEYGEGDVFAGVTVPQIRSVVKTYRDLPYADIIKLLKSPIHEERLCALLILVQRFSKGSCKDKQKTYEVYLNHIKYINNWDLIDLTACHIVGPYLKDKNKKILYSLANSSSLWERRIAVLATFSYIKDNIYTDSIKIAEILLQDTEDLIHKAVGWMLREIGKRNQQIEEKFLKKHYKTMPRTMLRYAIEKFPENKRKSYIKGTLLSLLTVTFYSLLF
ncbi:MAG: DNA alkylation repair protein [bacterium]